MSQDTHDLRDKVNAALDHGVKGLLHLQELFKLLNFPADLKDDLAAIIWDLRDLEVGVLVHNFNNQPGGDK